MSAPLRGRNALLAVFFLLGGHALAEPAQRRTLAELIALARQRAPIVIAAQAQVGVREAQRSEAIRYWFPSGEVNFLLTGAPRSICQVPDGEQATLNALPSDAAKEAFRKQNCINTVDPSGRSLSYFSTNFAGVGGELTLRLTQPIYTFGKIEHGVNAAEHGIRAEQQRVEVARNEVEMLVARAYWGLKAARTSVASSQEARDELTDWVHKIEDDLDREKQNYNFTINDLQRLKVGLVQIDILLADMQRNLGIARQGLRAAVGEDTDIDDAELDPVEIVEHPLEYYERAALTHRSEVRALDAGLAAYQELAKLKVSEMMPDLAFAGGITYRFAPTIEDANSAFVNHANVFGFGAFLAIRQPLDLVERHARLKHARADAEVFATQRKLALAGIGLEIVQAFENLSESRRRLDATDRGQRTARGWLSAVKQNIDLGTADARDLVESARSYYELRLRYYQAIYDFNVNVAVLRRATGVDIAK